MKLSTTTLGCLEDDLSTAVARISGWGFDGIDFRGLRGEFRLWLLPEFAADLAASARLIRDAGLAVSCISSGVRLVDTDPAVRADFEEELRRTAEICLALGCGQIRIFGGGLQAAAATEEDRPAVVAAVAARAAELAALARTIAPVDLLIETHDAWTRSEHLAEVLERCGRDDVACCWDVKHTWWMAAEVARTTWKRLGRWVRNTHWKDARRLDPDAIADKGIRDRVRGAGLLVPVGEGEAPLADALGVLELGGYDGWYTLEWERKWHPHIEPAAVAFPGFVAWMRERAALRQRPVASAGPS